VSEELRWEELGRAAPVFVEWTGLGHRSSQNRWVVFLCGSSRRGLCAGERVQPCWHAFGALCFDSGCRALPLCYAFDDDYDGCLNQAAQLCMLTSVRFR
jgi:hypothetical protein